MDFNFFLWPILIPMILPLYYCIKFKKESLKDVVYLIIIMVIIVFLYWPFLSINFLSSYTYIIVKIILFCILPISFLLIFKRDKSIINLKNFGLGKKGFKKSILLFISFVPIMLFFTFIIKYLDATAYESNILFGITSFFESFTEEFFFRGILFIFLLSKTNIRIAYLTSLTTFILMHPQHFQNYSNLFFISTIIQGFLTTEIARRSENITGAWLLHGTNRFFITAIIPLLIYI